MRVCVCLLKTTVMLSPIKTSQHPTASFNQLNVAGVSCVLMCFSLPLPFCVFHLSLSVSEELEIY